MHYEMPKITYFLRSNHDKKESHVIYCRVTFCGTKTEFSTKQKIKPSEWDQKTQRYTGPKKTTSILITSLLEKITFKIKSAALYTETQSAKLLIEEVRKKKVVANIEEFVLSYINDQRNTKAPGTLRNHSVKLENLKDYQRATGQKFTAQSFGLVEAENFKRWFQMRANTRNKDTANRHILFFRAAMVAAQRKGKLRDFPLFFYTGEKDAPKETIYLSPGEISKIYGHSFKSSMLQRVADLFLFQVHTGLSYGDLWGCWSIHVCFDNLVIRGERKKNAESFLIPMEPEALEILKKYAGQLPRYSNEVYNRILKEIAAICGIDKRISTHTGRKTFATLMNARGWSRESISDMLGHRSTKTTETYYLGRDFQRLENELFLRVS